MISPYSKIEFIICHFFSDGEVVLYNPANGDVVLNDCDLEQTVVRQSALNIEHQPIHLNEGSYTIEGNSSINLLSPGTTTSVLSNVPNSITTKVLGHTSLGVVEYEHFLSSGGTNTGG